MEQDRLGALVDEEIGEGTKFVHRETGNGGVSHHVGGTRYRNGAPQEHGYDDIRAKRDDLPRQAAAFFKGDSDHCAQALKNAKNLAQQVTHRTELYTLECASGKAAIFVGDTTIHLVFLAKSREQAGLGAVLIEEVIVECRRTFFRGCGASSPQAGRRHRRHLISVTLQECLLVSIGFYKAAGFQVAQSVSGATTGCTYDLSTDSCTLLVEKHAYRAAMQSIVPTLGAPAWTLRQVEHALRRAQPPTCCTLKRVIVDNGHLDLERKASWERGAWVVMGPEAAFKLLNSKKHQQVGVDTEALQGPKGMRNPPAQWGMAMVQLATADAIVIEFVWDEGQEALRPSAQLQQLLQDKSITKLTWGREFSESWPEHDLLQGVTNIQRAKGQVGGERGSTSLASLTEALSYGCSTLRGDPGDPVVITKESMAVRFAEHRNTSLYAMGDCEFLAYAGRDALAVLLAACFLRPKKAGSGQTPSLSGQTASLSTKPPKRASAGPLRAQLLTDLGWEDAPANPVYVTKQIEQKQPGDDPRWLWCATIDFGRLDKQGREGLHKFRGRLTTIKRVASTISRAKDLAAKVAFRRLDGDTRQEPAMMDAETSSDEPDEAMVGAETSSDESDDDSYGSE